MAAFRGDGVGGDGGRLLRYVMLTIQRQRTDFLQPFHRYCCFTTPQGSLYLGPRSNTFSFFVRFTRILLERKAGSRALLGSKRNQAIPISSDTYTRGKRYPCRSFVRKGQLLGYQDYLLAVRIYTNSCPSSGVIDVFESTTRKE
jgi:hypothetical protein